MTSLIPAHNLHSHAPLGASIHREHFHPPNIRPRTNAYYSQSFLSLNIFSILRGKWMPIIIHPGHALIRFTSNVKSPVANFTVNFTNFTGKRKHK